MRWSQGSEPLSRGLREVARVFTEDFRATVILCVLLSHFLLLVSAGADLSAPYIDVTSAPCSAFGGLLRLR